MPKRRANSLDIDAKLMVGITDSVRCSFTFWILQGTGLAIGWDGKVLTMSSHCYPCVRSIQGRLGAADKLYSSKTQ